MTLSLFCLSVNSAVKPGPDFPSDDEIYDMSDTDLLKLSIEKWKYIEEHAYEIDWEFCGDGGRITCALCRRFNPRIDSDIVVIEPCYACPIMEKTGMEVCQGTPYDEDRDFSPTDERMFLESLLKELEHYSTGGMLPVVEQCPTCASEGIPSNDYADDSATVHTYWSAFPLDNKGWCSVHGWVDLN